MTRLTSTKRPTLKTIAVETGLAVTTVSRALSDAPDIGAETKTLVRAVAKRIGYRPNRAGVRLRTGRSNVIAILLGQERLWTGNSAGMIHAFATELRDSGYHVIVTPTFDDEDPLDQLRYLRDTGSADAVVINRVMPNDPRIAFMHQEGMPFVTHGRSDMGIDHAWYDFDNYRFAQMAIDALVHRGRRKIAVLAPPIEQTYAQLTMAGAQEAAKRAGVECFRIEGATSDSDPEVVEAALIGTFETEQPDGLLCASISATLAAVAKLEEAGLTIGNEVDIASKEPSPFLQRFRTPIIAIAENVEEGGSFMARAALSAIRQPDAAPMTYLEVPVPPEVDDPT